MSRKVFFSFHYQNDINRSMVVRNSWVTQGKEAAGFIDKAEFEKIKRSGDDAVKRWIDAQLHGTSVTVVLIGSETLDRHFVQYEICESVNKGNAIIGVYIDGIKDMITNHVSVKGNAHTIIGSLNGRNIYFDEICDGLYDYNIQDGFHNLGKWIEIAAKAHDK